LHANTRLAWNLSCRTAPNRPVHTAVAY